MIGHSTLRSILLRCSLILTLGSATLPTIAQTSMVTYAGNTGKERFNDVLALSSGKVLVAGSADNLSWLPAGTPVTTLSVSFPTGVSGYTSSSASVAYLLLLSADQTTVEACFRMPAGTVADVSRIRTTSQTGAATGTIYISGRRTYTADNNLEGYYLAKLDNNFVAGNPTGCSWYYPVQCPPRGASPSAYKEIQPWDVDASGNVTFGRGTDYDFNWGAIYRLNGATGQLMIVNDWPAHWGNGGWTNPGSSQTTSEYEWDGTPATAAPATITVRKKSTPRTSPPDSVVNFTVKYSAIVLKAGRAGTLRSTTLADYQFDGLDENNNPRKSKYPDDFFFDGPLNGPIGFTGTGRGRLTAGTGFGAPGSGYFIPKPVPRLGGITIDKRDGAMYYGYSTQSRLPSGLPDFEPAIVAMTATGKMKWWARNYNQKAVSEPDQYIDAVEVDYSSNTLVVLARQHGSGSNIYWKGGQLYYTPGAACFQNGITGVNTVQTGHYTWIGKYDLITAAVPLPTFPKLYRCTYMGEYADNIAGYGTPSTDPKMDGWAPPNSGFPDLNTTRAVERMAVTTSGSVCVLASGRRTITTSDAFQKMVKPGAGSSTWNDFVRVYRPDLSGLVYSSILTGAWNTSTGEGGGNVDLQGLWPTNNGILVTGWHSADAATGVASGNPMPTTNVPAWGKTVAQSEQAVFGRLAFVNTSPITIAQGRLTFCGTAPVNTYSLSFTPPPSFLVTYAGNTFLAELSNEAGKFAEDGGTSTTIGTVASNSNTTQTVPITITGIVAGAGYGIRVRSTSPSGPGFWYSATIVTAAPGQPGAVSGPVQVCSNSAGSSVYSVRKVAGASSYEWRFTPTENLNPPPACNNDPGCAGILAQSDTSAVIIWNPTFSGAANIEVRAVNPCGNSAWQALAIPLIAPCVTTNFSGAFCEGATGVKVPFSVPAGITMSGGNVFTAQLSDATGSFASPTIIGTRTVPAGVSPRLDTVTAAFPTGVLVAGSFYKVRILATGVSPQPQGDPSVPITVQVLPVAPVTPRNSDLTTNYNICYDPTQTGYTRSYSINAVADATQYLWELNPASAGTITSGTDAIATVIWNNNPGTAQIRVRVVNGCGSGAYSSYRSVTIGSCLVTNLVPTQTWCAGTTMNVTQPSGAVQLTMSGSAGLSFTTSNVQLAYEVSDNNGDFTNLTASTTVTSANSLTTALNVSLTLPATAVPSANYRVRVRCSDNCYNNLTGNTRFAPLYSTPIPLTLSNAAASALSAPTGATTSLCGTSQAYSVSTMAGATGYTWSVVPASAATITPSGTSASIAWANTFTGYSATVSVTATLPCGNVVSQPLAVATGCSPPTFNPTTPTCLPIVSAIPSVPTGTYRTNGGNVTFTSAASWQRWNGSSWANATQAPGICTGCDATAGAIYWFNNMTVDQNVTLGTNGPVVQWSTTGSNQSLSISSGFTLTIADGAAPVDLEQNLIINANGGSLVFASGAVGQMKSTAAYVHNFTTGGTIPSMTWCDGSLAQIPTSGMGNGSATTPAGLGQNFFNFSFLSTSHPANFTLQPNNMQVRNLFIVNSNTANPFYLGTGTGSGSMFADSVAIQSCSGNSGIFGGSGTGSFTINCRGMSISGSTWNGSANGTGGSGNLNILQHPTVASRGNLYHTTTSISRVAQSTLSTASPTWIIFRDYVMTNIGGSFSLAGGTNSAGNISLNIGRDMTLANAFFGNGGTSTNTVNLIIGRDFNWNGSSPYRCVDENISAASMTNINIGRDYNFANSNASAVMGNGNAGAGLQPAGHICNFTVGRDMNVSRNTSFRGYGGSAETQALINARVLGTVNVTGTANFALSQETGSGTRPNMEVSLGGINMASTGGFFTTERTTVTFSSSIKVSGNISQSAGSLFVNNTINTPMSVYLAGNLTHSGGTFAQAGGTASRPVVPIIFNGTGTQAISVTSTGTNRFNQQTIRLILDKPSGVLSLNSALYVPQLSWVQGNLNLNGNRLTLKDTTLYAPGRNLTVYGATVGGGVVGQLTGFTGGILSTPVLYLQRGILDNTVGNFLSVSSSAATAVQGASDTAYVAGNLGLAIAASASSAAFTYPIGSTTQYRPITLNSFSNDATAKTLLARYAGAGPSQAGTSNFIQDLGLTTAGAANWLLQRSSGSGSVAISSATLQLSGLTAQSRIGQSLSLTNGYSSAGGDLQGTTNKITTGKALTVSAIEGTGLYLALGNVATVTPPGGGYTVGPGGDFANLTQVAAQYNDVAYTTPAIFTFTSAYNGRADDVANPAPETFPITFRQNQTQPVTIRYQGNSFIETSSSIANPVQAPLIILDGADKITFSGNDKWRYLNKGKCVSCAAFALQNDATYNNITDIVAEGSSTSNSYQGVIAFNTSNQTLGNSYNVINSSKLGSNNERRRTPTISLIVNNAAPGLSPGAVIDASNTNPVVISIAGPHGFTTGDRVNISGVMGNQAANGFWSVTVLTSTTFSIPVASSGNFSTSLTNAQQISGTPTNLNPSVVTTIGNHNMRDGSEVRMLTATNSGSNYWVDSLTATTFAVFSDPALLTGINVSTNSFTKFNSVYTNGSATPSITAISSTTPIQLTLSAPHNLSTGQAIWIKNVLGNTGANGIFLVTRIDNYRFILDNSITSGTWSGGGYFAFPPLVAVAANHGMLSGQRLTIAGVSGVTTANGIRYVRPITPSALALFRDATLLDPAILSNPIPPASAFASVVITRPSVPHGTNLTVSGASIISSGNATNQQQVTLTVSPALSANIIGRSLRVVITGVTGSISPPSGANGMSYFNPTALQVPSGGSNGVNLNTCATVISTTQIQLLTNAQGSYVSGGLVFISNLGTGNLVNTYRLPAPSTTFYNPQINASGSGGGSCMVVDDPFTVSGIVGYPGLNGSFRVIGTPFSDLNYGAWALPSPANPLYAGSAGYPFNGVSSAAADSLVDKVISSQNTGTTLNQYNTISGNEIANFQSGGVLTTVAGTGNGWNVSGNSFYNLFGPAPLGVSQMYGVNLIGGSKSNSNIVANNFFGGQAAQATGGPFNITQTGISFCPIHLSVGSAVTSQVTGNTIRNMNFGLAPNGGNRGLQAMWLEDGAILCRKNVIGGYSALASQDTIFSAVDANSSIELVRINSSGPVEFANNLISRINVSKAIDIISLQGTGKITVRGNTIRNVGGVQNPYFNAINVASGTSQDVTIDTNRIHNVFSDFTGIRIGAKNTTGRVRANRVFGNGGGSMTGILYDSILTNSSAGWQVYNNEITNTFASRQSDGSQGIRIQAAPGAGQPPAFYFNSVMMTGGNNTGPGSSTLIAALHRKGTGTAIIKNNLLYSIGLYQGGTFPGYAIAVTNTSGWSGSNCTNNLLYGANGQNQLGLYGSNVINDIGQWHAIAGGADNVYSSANFIFDQPAIDGNLRLSAENCPIKDKGTNVAIFDDADTLNTRDKARPDIGINEFSRAIPTGAFWTGAVSSDWNTDANWCDSRVPLETEDVTISNAPIRRYMPVVSGPTAACRNLNLINNPGSMVVVHGSTAALTITGKSPLVKFTNTNLAHISGTIWFNSDSAQNIPAPAISESFAGRNTAQAPRRVSAMTYTNSPDIITITTATNHGLELGDLIQLRSIQGLANVNTNHKVIEKVSLTQFKVRYFTSGTYMANTGRMIPLAALPVTATSGFGITPVTVTTARAHNLAVGQYVALAGIGGNTAANGSWQVLSAPTTTTFTVGATGNNSFSADTNGYALPAQTGYYDLYLDGAGTKTTDGQLSAASININNGKLMLTKGGTIVRDSIYISPTGELQVTAGTTQVGSLRNYGGIANISAGGLTATDSILTVAGTTSITGPVTSGRLISRGGTTTVTTGPITLTDTLALRSGTITLDVTSGTIKNMQLRSGTLRHLQGSITVQDTLGMRGAVLLHDGDITVQRRLKLVAGNIAPIASTTSVIEVTDVSTNAVMGGSQASFVETGLRQYSNSLDGGRKITIGTGTSATTPIVVTSSNHGFNTGEFVLVQGTSGNANANGICRVNRLTNNNFELVSTVGAGTSGVNTGTITRMTTRTYPIGRNGLYRPSILYLTQTAATSTGYTARFSNLAPPSNALPGNLPAYGGGTDQILSASLVGFTRFTSTGANMDAGGIALSYANPEGVTRHNRRFLTILKDSTPSPNWLHLYGNSTDSVSALKYITSTRPFRSFSDFTLGFMQNQPLPLGLLSFTGKADGRRSLLNWRTANEQNTSRFELERSYDGKDFSYLLTRAAAGSSQSVREYAGTDEEAFGPGRSLAYYRLRMLDRDGAQTYSGTVTLRSAEGKAASLEAWPNPFSEQVRLSFTSAQAGQAQISITDALGRQVLSWSQTLATGTATLTNAGLSKLPTGSYTLTCALAGEQSRLHLIKQ